MISLSTCAQGFKVKSLKIRKSDNTAATSPRTDRQGRTCGLVKVSSKLEDLEFGDVVGNVTRSDDEYLVYLADGAQSFTIARPHYLPTTVHVKDFDVECIVSKTTYAMEVKAAELDMEKCGVTLQVKPTTTQVTVDGVPLKMDAIGYYKLVLAKGEHQFDFSAYGCRSTTRPALTGKGMVRMEVEMESILADLTLLSKTEGAEILVNGEMKSRGRWTGKMLPGKYTVEQRLKGYLPSSQTITLGEKEQKTLDLGALEHIKGTLHVTTQPTGCKLWLDGKECGQTPCDVADVLYGQHTLAAQVDSNGVHRKSEKKVSIEEVGEQHVKVNVITDDELEFHREALECFRRAFHLDVKGESVKGYMPQQAAKASFDSIMDKMDQLDKTFFLHTEHFPEYEFNELISPNQCIGERMFMYYAYVDITEDEPIRLKGNVKYTYVKQPDKAVRVAQKMGKELSRRETAYVAISYYKTGNYEQAVPWFQKWYDQGLALGEEDDYFAGRSYFMLGDAYKKLGQSEEAKEWQERALTILEQTETNQARLKKFRLAAKTA